MDDFWIEIVSRSSRSTICVLSTADTRVSSLVEGEQFNLIRLDSDINYSLCTGMLSLNRVPSL